MITGGVEGLDSHLKWRFKAVFASRPASDAPEGTTPA